MNIITKTGDQGATALMYNRRVSKCHLRVEAYGAVDELNAALGLARAAAKQRRAQDALLAVQEDLIPLMGELATAVEDLPRYLQDGHPRTSSQMTERLEALANSLAEEIGPLRGWALPGANPSAASLDFARTVCRRAERAVCSLSEQGQLQNPEIIKYVNRLSDLLWLLARSAEALE